MVEQINDGSRLDAHVLNHVLDCTGAAAVTDVEAVQSLWSGFGQIVRLRLSFDNRQTEEFSESVIVKHVNPPLQPQHPRGWNSDASTQRKLRSYRVETIWYQQYAASCNRVCTVPKHFASHSTGQQSWLILEDLDVSFPRRHTFLSIEACKPCLRWLARFHAHHLQAAGDGLWPIGSYWHLQTRQHELINMADGALKHAAVKLDTALNSCPFQTLIHGDAKVANFCFSDGIDQADIDTEVAMVDFQYVGRGCGMRDVAYFLGSCLSDADCESYADTLLTVYFAELAAHLPVAVRQAVEDDWRALYAVAWADFNRFLAGWMPEHPKINSYMQTMTEQALVQL